jgi:hypothetical protein
MSNQNTLITLIQMRNNRHTAIGECKKCKELLVSEAGGLFVQCKCKSSFIDQERMAGLWVRCGGNLDFIEQICPPCCKDKDHKRSNKTIKTLDDLVLYLVKNYRYIHSSVDNKNYEPELSWKDKLFNYLKWIRNNLKK